MQQVRQSKAFIKSESEVPNLGVSRHAFWLKFTIRNESPNSNFLLNVAHPMLDAVTLFYPDSTSVVLGTGKPFSQRKYKTPNYIFDLNIPQGMAQSYFMCVKSTEYVMLPIFITTDRILWQNLNRETILFGIFVGFVLVIFFYNLFIYLSTQDKSYLYYILYVLTVGLTHTSAKGIPFQYLWPNTPKLEAINVTLFASLGGIFIVLFSQYFLHTKKYTKIGHTILSLIGFIFLSTLILAITGYNFIGFQIMQANTMLLSISVLIVSYYIMIAKRYRPARFFSISWSIFFICMLVFLLKEYGILPYNMVTNYSMFTGVALEMIFLSFALGDRINIMRRETAEAQLLQRRALEDQLVIAQALDQTQTDLIKTARLANMGRTIARIAHELNTPIYMARSSADHLVKQTQQLLHNLRSQFASNAMGSLKEYEQNMIKMSQGLLTSLDRAFRLVSNFRETSADQANVQKKYFKLKDYINTTLVSHELSLQKRQIQVDLRGDNPVLYSDPGFIYQIIQNLLTNTERYGYPEGEGKIDIELAEQGQSVVIVYKDYGKGMSSEVVSKLFSPFYTTGEGFGGIGLGMSIVHSVVTEYLHGTIDCESAEDCGVTFTITLDKEQLS